MIAWIPLPGDDAAAHAPYTCPEAMGASSDAAPRDLAGAPGGRRTQFIRTGTRRPYPLPAADAEQVRASGRQHHPIPT